MAQVSECPKQGANALSVRSRRRLKRIFTADDLLHLPDAPDGRCYELVGGRLYELPPPSLRHGHVTSNVAFLLETHIRQFRLGRVMAGDTGFILARSGYGKRTRHSISLLREVRC